MMAEREKRNLPHSDKPPPSPPLFLALFFSDHYGWEEKGKRVKKSLLLPSFLPPPLL